MREKEDLFELERMVSEDAAVDEAQDDLSSSSEMAGLGDDQGDESQEAGGKVTASELLSMVEAQCFRCALTGWELEPNVAFVDHIQPLCKGGSHSIENLQAVHAIVNAAKGMLTQDEFLRMCIAVANGPAVKRG